MGRRLNYYKTLCNQDSNLVDSRECIVKRKYQKNRIIDPRPKLRHN